MAQKGRRRKFLSPTSCNQIPAIQIMWNVYSANWLGANAGRAVSPLVGTHMHVQVVSLNKFRQHMRLWIYIEPIDCYITPGINPSVVLKMRVSLLIRDNKSTVGLRKLTCVCVHVHMRGARNQTQTLSQSEVWDVWAWPAVQLSERMHR